MTDIDVRAEMQKVVSGELAYVDLAALAKSSDYAKMRLVDIAKELGLVVHPDLPQHKYRATLPVGRTPHQIHTSQRYRRIEENEYV